MHMLFFMRSPHLQGAESQMQQVLDRKVADKDVINQGDATQLARAEAKLNDGQIPPNSISSKAQVCALHVTSLFSAQSCLLIGGKIC